MDQFRDLGKVGCCLSCTECGHCDEVCFNCICVPCDQYDEHSPIKRCSYAQFKRQKETYKITILGQTKKAIECRIFDYNINVWLPKSQIELKSVNEIKIPHWLAEEIGIEKDGWFELDGFTIKQLEISKLSKKGDWR